MPKVTVLMAVYNGERFLQEAIESILGQTFQDFEFLIINDGSTDNTRELILSYDDSRIRLVDNGYNLGLARSLNRGIELAKGQFIARQDVDDISEPERLDRQVTFMETHPEVALLGTCYKEIDALGTIIENKRLPCDCTQIRWSLLFFCPFVHSAVMLRKSAVLEQVGVYNEVLAYSQDYELWLRVALCLKVANLDEYLVRVRIHPRSMTATYGRRTQEGYRIRVSNMGALLGWNSTDMASNEIRFNKMMSFLFKSPSYLTVQDVSWAVEEVLRLHPLFCERFKITPSDCIMHRAALYTRISRHLIKMARSYINIDYTGTWQLLFKALRLYQLVLLTGKARH